MPNPGDVFAVKHPRGYFGAVRVIRSDRRSCLAYCSTYLERKPPVLSDPRIRRVQRQTRFHFEGQPSLIWVDGEPPGNYRLIGSLPPTGAEARRNSQTYGGWLAACGDAWLAWRLIHEPAKLEREIRAEQQRDAEQQRARLRHQKPKAMMPEAEFWKLIALLDWKHEGDDRKVLAPLVRALATKPQAAIQRFHERLAQLLFRLDTREHARRIGVGAWKGDGARFSPDGFLYARCACVARGEESYYRALGTPRHMPRDTGLESLLDAAPDAHEKKTGKPFNYFTGLSYESQSSFDGWLPRKRRSTPSNRRKR